MELQSIRFENSADRPGFAREINNGLTSMTETAKHPDLIKSKTAQEKYSAGGRSSLVHTFTSWLGYNYYNNSYKEIVQVCGMLNQIKKIIQRLPKHGLCFEPPKSHSF